MGQDSDEEQLAEQEQLEQLKAGTTVFPDALTFVLRPNLWSLGGATITGPGGHPWFSMDRTTQQWTDHLFSGLRKNCQFLITNLLGEPQLALKERFQWRDYEYDLFRLVNVDEMTRQQLVAAASKGKLTGVKGNSSSDDIRRALPKGVHPDHVASITRKWHFIGLTADYRVECPRFPNLSVVGSWPNSFTLLSNNQTVATMQKSVWTSTWNLTVEPQQDCLLLIGIALAIVRIHKEVQIKNKKKTKKRRRR